MKNKTTKFSLKNTLHKILKHRIIVEVGFSEQEIIVISIILLSE